MGMRATISQVRCATSALLILNLQPSSEREEQKCYRTHLVRALLWNMEFSFFQLFLLEWLQQVMQKKKSSTRVCVGWLAFKRVINGDWFCVCEYKCVCWPWAQPAASYSVSPLWALSLVLWRGLYLPTTDTLLSVKGERHQWSTPAAPSPLTYCRQPAPLQGGCEPFPLPLYGGVKF